MRLLRRDGLIILIGLLLSGPNYAQDYGGRLGTQRGGQVHFEPRGPGVLFGALDPAVKKWYVPQELFADYGWRQWQYSNYARESYQRYVNTTLEGDYFYDFYGNFIGRGWLIYDWRQNQPQQLGSSIFKDSLFGNWFNSVVIGGESQGQYHYSITVGNQIRTTLTPMTFSKPAFNGVQIDFAADKYAATILASRIGDPVTGQTGKPSTLTNTTGMLGARATVQLGDFVEVGATLVNARNSSTSLDLFSGNLVAGSLVTGQSSKPVTAIAIVLSDDTPEDGKGGAALFSHQVRIVSLNFATNEEEISTLEDVVRPGSEWPVVFGGFRRSRFVAADGAERIILNYDFNDPSYVGPDPTAIVKVEFDYVLANDFKIEMWSDRQTGKQSQPAPPLSSEIISASQPALLTVRRAAGNVQDASNLQRVKFAYGLPTANLVGGFTLSATSLWGFDFYGEWDRNRRYSQYPNAALFSAGKKHQTAHSEADAWHFNLSRQFYPWFGYAEVYSFDEAYSTSAFLTDANGDIHYDDPQRYRYEFVEDNDDQDRFADWIRFGAASDRLIFPGWDENNDFISDFNQNDNSSVANLVPDYDEPFLRYEVDRPEFLFGIDLNNNNWIDRFEDDDLADYPYKPDRRGYNAFIGVNLTPAARLILGRTDEKMPSSEGENRTTYALLTFDRNDPRLGHLRFFEMLKRSADTIPDDRREPTPFIDAPPIQPIVRDLLSAQDTWISTTWIGWDNKGRSRLTFVNKLKYEIFHQNGALGLDLEGRRLRRNASFLGLINKVDYAYPVHRFEVRPQLKSEFLRQMPFVHQQEKRQNWIATLQLLAGFPLLRHTQIEAGCELLWFRDLVRDEEELLELGLAQETGDMQSTILAMQLSTNSAYQGYQLITQLGFRVGRTRNEILRGGEGDRLEKAYESNNEMTSFITVYAGIE